MFSGLTLVTGSQLIVKAHYFERRSVLSTDNLLAWDYGTMHTWQFRPFTNCKRRQPSTTNNKEKEQALEKERASNY